MRPIRFDKATGIVYLNNQSVGNLPIDQRGYSLFSVLYDSPNIPISADDIIGLAKFNSGSKTSVVYIDQAIDEAIDTKL